MQRVRGRGLGVGTVLGTAAVVRTRSGIPILPPMPRRLAEDRARHRSSEPPHVILIADDYDMAQSVAHSLPWGRVVGIVAASAPPDLPASDLPAVVDVPIQAERMTNDMLILLDAGRGLVLIDPEAALVAQYQAEAERIAPRRRLFLEGAHLPAHTLDGVVVQVIAEASEPAVTAGADALYLTLRSEPPVSGVPPPAPEQQLEEAVRVAAGKPLFLMHTETIPAAAMVQAATRVDLVLVVPVQNDPSRLTQVATDLITAETLCQEQGKICHLPLLAAAVTMDFSEADEAQDITRIETLAARGAARVLAQINLDSPRCVRRFADVVAAATSALLPVFVHVDEHTLPGAPLEEIVRTLLGAGVSGLLTWHGQVATLKELIRTLNVAECREALLRQFVADGEMP
ncbi:MAG: hypothetical protein RMJ43_05755 [Chloroherpetonaceae bacterium]|nr:hypothetical protein [Chthonomonadaceae bacterium]MDW8207321.1 hypothetical protein [Chloroherpetonaceae bacterium]